MKAAIVMEAGRPPVFGDFEEPVRMPDRSRIRVTAAALSQLARSRASGMHYSAGQTLPFIPGIDGCGVTESGQRVYFLALEAPQGSMAEFCSVDARSCIALPPGLSDAAAAALGNPGMSSWAALVERAKLQAGETVLINGATGASGRLAIQIARHLGAGKVIATGRRQDMFAELTQLGADVTIPLQQDAAALAVAFERAFQPGVDVVLDYVWGASAQALVVAAAKAQPQGQTVRYVQIGSIGGASIELPGAALRSSALQLMGSGIGSVTLERLLKAIEGVLQAAPAAGFEVAFETVPLAEVTRAWDAADTGSRIVLQP